MTSDPFSSFAWGVKALDDALIAEPVYASERGLSRRRERLGRTFKKALLAYLKSHKETVADVEAVREMIGEVEGIEP